MSKPFLEIDSLRRTYNQSGSSEVIALNDFSLRVAHGEFVTIVGSNAAGKSTLFNCICGTIPPSSGVIELDGLNLIPLPEYKRSALISRVKQNPNDGVIASLTLAENLVLAKIKTRNAKLQRGVTPSLKQEFFTLLKPFGIGLEKRLDDSVYLLSGGQKQTVALLMATLTQPKLLLLDEHTAALDPKISRKILEITDNLVREKKITTLMITHNLNHAIDYGDRLILMSGGKTDYEAKGKIKKKLTVNEVVSKIEGKIAELEEDLPGRKGRW